MAFFGLKLGLDLEIRAAHPHQKFQRVPPRALSKADISEVLRIQTVNLNLTEHLTTNDTTAKRFTLKGIGEGV